VLLGRTGRVRPPGLFALYVAGYSGFRIFEETLRVDPAHHLLGLRLNFFVASVLCAGGLAWFAHIQTWWLAGAWCDAPRSRVADRCHGRLRPRWSLKRSESRDFAAVLPGSEAAHHRVGVRLLHPDVGGAG